jgi:hypothetical protein
MAILWRDNSHKVMNVHNPPAEGNLCDEQDVCKITYGGNITVTFVMWIRETGWPAAALLLSHMEGAEDSVVALF